MTSQSSSGDPILDASIDNEANNSSKETTRKLLRPDEEILFPVSRGRYSVPLMKTPTNHMTSPTLGLTLPTLIYREDTRISRTSMTSSPGPLTMASSRLRNQLRTQTRGGTRYVMRFNRYKCKVDRDGGRTPRKRQTTPKPQVGRRSLSPFNASNMYCTSYNIYSAISCNSVYCALFIG